MSSTVATDPTRIQHPRWGVVCMLLSIVFFSANSLTLKLLAELHISSWVSLMFRASVGMCVVSLAFPRSQIDYRRALTNRLLAGRGLLGVFGTMAYYFTIAALGPGKATLISNTYVVLAALLAVWLLKESFSTSKLAGNVLAIAGLTLLVASPKDLDYFGWYDALGVFGALMAAGTVIIIRELTRTESTAMIYTSQCIYVLAVALPFAIVEMVHHPLTLTSAIVLTLAGLSATIGQLAMTEGFRHLTVAVGGAFQICVPIVISIGGVWLFNEQFTIGQLCGAALILAGCYWVTVVR